ncbi:hypothetical protein CRUP_025779 [Coryphaenoides rupestris]|nr:hypothetical protein CRUP_025779 [Coryphaenoides rupestris]
MIGRNTPGGGALLGKDYMLAIIMVNCHENIWSDQSITDPDLPSDWRTITDSSGTYYWHVASGATQWQHPCNGSWAANSTNQATPHKEQEIEERSEDNSDEPDTKVPNLQCLSGLTVRDTKVFSVRSLGWVEVPEEGLFPGRSSLTVNNIIQQLSHHRTSEQTHWGEGQEMLLVLKKDMLSLMDPLNHTLLHSQPISNIRVWGVGCSNGSSSLCSLFMSSGSQSGSFLPSFLPSFLVDLQAAVKQHVPKFVVQYIGNLAVSRAMGDEALWECQVRHVTFLGVGQDSHTLAVIADGGRRGFQCHVFWCEPHAGDVSEAMQAACMADQVSMVTVEQCGNQDQSEVLSRHLVLRAEHLDPGGQHVDMNREHVDPGGQHVDPGGQHVPVCLHAAVPAVPRCSDSTSQDEARSHWPDASGDLPGRLGPAASDLPGWLGPAASDPCWRQGQQLLQPYHC